MRRRIIIASAFLIALSAITAVSLIGVEYHNYDDPQNYPWTAISLDHGTLDWVRLRWRRMPISSLPNPRRTPSTQPYAMFFTRGSILLDYKPKPVASNAETVDALILSHSRVAVWPLLFLSAIYPVIVIATACRSRRRNRMGFCISCGYSLTGNVSGVCPECGTAVTAQSDPQGTTVNPL